jgi:hypothetical protein
MRQFTKPKQTVNISNGKVKNWYGRSLLRGNSIAYSLLQSLSFVVNVGALCAPKKIIFLKQASTKNVGALSKFLRKISFQHTVQHKNQGDRSFIIYLQSTLLSKRPSCVLLFRSKNKNAAV